MNQYSPTVSDAGSVPGPSSPRPTETKSVPYTITVRFAAGMDDAHAEAFKEAANRWVKVIRGGLSPVEIDGEVITGILILTDVADLDGPSHELAAAHPTHFRPDEAERGAGLPAKGEMVFDRADLDRLAKNGSLVHVITHEMGHVLGIGSGAWYEMVKDQGGDRRFYGRSAMREYAKLRASDAAGEPVPIDAGAHWSESIMGNELMSGAIFGNDNRLSRLTVASLEDLGYEVDYSGADKYTLPSSARDERHASDDRPSARAARYHSCKSVRQWVARVLPKSALVKR